MCVRVHVHVHVRVRVCVHVHVCVCPLQVIEVVIIKLGTVSASDMRMHYMLIILTVTFIIKVTQILLVKINV